MDNGSKSITFVKELLDWVAPLSPTQEETLKFLASILEKGNSSGNWFSPAVLSRRMYWNAKKALPLANALKKLYGKKLVSYLPGRNQFEPGTYAMSESGRMLVGQRQYRRDESTYVWAFPEDSEGLPEYSWRFKRIFLSENQPDYGWRFG